MPLQGELAASRQLGLRRKPPAYVWWLVLAAVVIHALFAWYLATHHSDSSRSRKTEVAVELVKPPARKIDPPKPPPPKPQRPAQVLPPIQESVPLASESPTVSSEPPVAVAPVSAPPAPAPPPVVTAAFGRAGYLNNPPPEYPAAALRQGWQGTVTLRVRVLSTGHVEGVEVQKSSGRKLLDDEAVRTVRGWLFAPSKRGDSPIDGWATVPIEFKVE